MIKKEFLLTISIQYQEDEWWELRKILQGDYKLIQYQIFWTSIIRIVWQTVRRISKWDLGREKVKGYIMGKEGKEMAEIIPYPWLQFKVELENKSLINVLCLAVAILNFSFMLWCYEFGKRKPLESIQSMMMSPLFKIDYSPPTLVDP